MSFFRYLLDKILPIAWIVIGIVAWTIFAVLASVERFIIFTTDLCVVGAVLLFFILDFCLLRHRLRRLQTIAETMEEKYLLGEVLPRPVSGVEREYFFVMRKLSHTVIDEVELAKSEREEFCDYVESWIHEIKTPLTACSLILANGGDWKRLRTELKRAENLTESILYSARLRTIENDIKLTQFHAVDCMNEAVKSQMELLLAAEISVTAEGDFTVYSDYKTIVFVLKQILVNCAKYCPRCHISLTAENGAITVEDDGIGIPPHELPRVFDRGFSGTAAKSKGTGMGLYFAKKLCDFLGVELSVQSETGKFTRFLLVFPKNG